MDHRVAHPLRKGLVLGSEHAAQAHPLGAQHIQVQVGVAFELGRGADRAGIEGHKRRGETRRIPTDQRLTELCFAREMIMQRGFGQMELGGHIRVAEAVEATALGKALGDIKNLGRGINVPMPTLARHRCSGLPSD